MSATMASKPPGCHQDDAGISTHFFPWMNSLIPKYSATIMPSAGTAVNSCAHSVLNNDTCG